MNREKYFNFSYKKCEIHTHTHRSFNFNFFSSYTRKVQHVYEGVERNTYYEDTTKVGRVILIGFHAKQNVYISLYEPEFFVFHITKINWNFTVLLCILNNHIQKKPSTNFPKNGWVSFQFTPKREACAHKKIHMTRHFFCGLD